MKKHHINDKDSNKTKFQHPLPTNKMFFAVLLVLVVQNHSPLKSTKILNTSKTSPEAVTISLKHICCNFRQLKIHRHKYNLFAPTSSLRPPWIKGWTIALPPTRIAIFTSPHPHMNAARHYLLINRATPSKFSVILKTSLWNIYSKLLLGVHTV